MIGPCPGVRVYLACGVTDMGNGIGGLAALAEDHLRQKPTRGSVFAFRGAPQRPAEALALGWARVLHLLEGAGKGPLPLARVRRKRGASDLGASRAVLWAGIERRRPD